MHFTRCCSSHDVKIMRESIRGHQPYRYGSCRCDPHPIRTLFHPSLQKPRRMLVYRNTECFICFPKLLGYLIPSKRLAKIVSILHSRDHYVPSFLLLYNSKNLRIWYSDSLQIAILTYDVLVLGEIVTQRSLPKIKITPFKSSRRGHPQSTSVLLPQCRSSGLLPCAFAFPSSSVSS